MELEAASLRGYSASRRDPKPEMAARGSMPNTVLARSGVIDETVPAWWAQVEDDPDEAALDNDDLEDEDWDDDDLDEVEFGDDENDGDWDDDDSEEELDGLAAADEDEENESW